MSSVRVRIAPSPTGNLHVGTARTALFNYLFAKGQGGTFILRIEDSDTERSKEEYVHNIFDSLRSIGIEWDEGPDVGGDKGPYTQMDRLALYQDYANKLVEAGLAYKAYETPEELTAQREAMQKAGEQDYKYQRPTAEVLAQQQADSSRKPSIRFAVPADRGHVLYQDIVRGEVSIDSNLAGDFVILKSDGTPTYNFAVVIDDMLMEISHVIRGEDHISNMPRQIMLYEALESLNLLKSPVPQFAHVGMILAPDRSKLSKRHGATAVSDFVAQGYLPEAFCNYMALLGWSPPDGKEVASLEDFARQFKLEKIAHSPAIFERDKLNWFNGQYIRQMELGAFVEIAKPFLFAEFDLSQYDDEKLTMMLDAIRKNLTTLSDIPETASYFFEKELAQNPETVKDVLMNEEGQGVLEAFERDFVAKADFTSPEALGDAMKTFIESQKPLKTKAVMWPIRVAISGRTQGADLAKTLYLLGKERIQARLTSARQLMMPSS